VRCENIVREDRMENVFFLRKQCSRLCYYRARPTVRGRMRQCECRHRINGAGIVLTTGCGVLLASENLDRVVFRTHSSILPKKVGQVVTICDTVDHNVLGSLCPVFALWRTRDVVGYFSGVIITRVPHGPSVRLSMLKARREIPLFRHLRLGGLDRINT
jgi:hypothetical protein